MAPVIPCYASENSLLRVRREFASRTNAPYGLLNRRKPPPPNQGLPMSRASLPVPDGSQKRPARTVLEKKRAVLLGSGRARGRWNGCLQRGGSFCSARGNRPVSTPPGGSARPPRTPGLRRIAALGVPTTKPRGSILSRPVAKEANVSAQRAIATPGAPRSQITRPSPLGRWRG
jgi:hypothetical protein